MVLKELTAALIVSVSNGELSNAPFQETRILNNETTELEQTYIIDLEEREKETKKYRIEVPREAIKPKEISRSPYMPQKTEN
jgi:hypothetical protein